MSRRDPPEVRQARGSPAPVPGRCGFKLALTDPPRYCLMRPKPGGNGRCGRFGHNARQTQGVGADNRFFKDGRHSRYAFLNPQVLDMHAAAMQDERLLDLTDDVAWLEVLKGDRLSALETGASAEGWKQARQAFRDLKAAMQAGQKGPARDAMRKLDELFGLHAGKALAQEALERTLERKARIVRVRQQVLTDSENMIPGIRVAAVLAGVAGLVREFITDEAQRREFSRKLIGFVGERLRPRDQIVEVRSETEPGNETGAG